jgi:hypothetical protein
VRRRGHGAFFRALVTVALASLFVVAGLAPVARASSYPTLPLADDRGFLGNLSAPSLAPGGSGAVSFSVGDPLSVALTSAVLTLQVYAFNGFPGNATATVSVAGAPVLSNATSSGGSVSVSLGSLSGTNSYRGSVGVATSASTPSGAFAIRSALVFVANGTDYRLESRGWFSSTVWAAATELPNGSATLNLTVLGVSGVLPETAVEIQESAYPWILGGVLVAAAVLVGVGAWVYFRRGPESSSGMRSAEDDHQAPSAFGKSRTKDGD